MRAARTSVPAALVALTTALLVAAPGEARADDDQLKLDWSAQIQSDLRFRLVGKSVGDYYNTVSLPAGVERNQNRFGLKLSAKYGRFSGVADVDFVILGTSGALAGLSSLSKNEEVQPYRFDLNSLYIQAKDLFFDGFDLRVGQQIVLWGVGDQFNPTNNLNPDDLRDPLLFGKQAGNFMVKADYWINDEWSLTGVLVPVFKPALLPFTAPLATSAIDRVPFLDANFRHRIESEFAFSASNLVGYPTVAHTVTPVLPDPSFGNMQFAFRLGGTVAEQDVSLSYYNGRTDFPQPFHTHTTQVNQVICDPQTPRCVKGLLQTETQLGYPKMHVYGLNATGEIPISWIKKTLRGIGYRLEGAIVVPRAQEIKLTNTEIQFGGGLIQQEGEYDYDGSGVPGSGKRPLVVENTPFAKWVVGLDYAFGDHVYTNVQWVHGLADEYGAGDFFHKGYAVRASGVSTNPTKTLNNCVLQKSGETCAREVLRNRLGDYLSLGTDLKFLSDKVLMRIFGILDLTGLVYDEYDEKKKERVQTTKGPFSKEGFSMVLYPDLNYNFGNGLELGAGALVQMGKPYTKFGDAAAGGSLIFTRARYSF